MTQIRLRVDAVECARTKQAVPQCAALITMVELPKQISFFPRQTALNARSSALLSGARQPIIGVITPRIPLV
ncbi:MAG: hypothetical protein G5701_01800 [Serratia symbiotica]|nr:hypothetical protein [Serratia symbiotica]